MNTEHNGFAPEVVCGLLKKMFCCLLFQSGMSRAKQMKNITLNKSEEVMYNGFLMVKVILTCDL